MRRSSERVADSAEKTVRDIRRATRRRHSAEDKIRIVLEGLRGEVKRAGKPLRKLKTYLGRVIRDIRRKIAGEDGLREAFVKPLHLAERVLAQDRRQRGRKVYSLHAPEVECIGKGKAHKPYNRRETPVLHGRLDAFPSNHLAFGWCPTFRMDG